MVVYAASILTNAGKILLSRQFVNLPKFRVEALLSAFPKLLDSHKNEELTFFETESVRYFYTPLNKCHLLLLTSRQSNVLEDISTLRLLHQICQEVPLDEESLSSKAFDLIFAFDEVIVFGYREASTLAQIKNYVLMDSHEERLQDMIRKSREVEENEKRKKIAMRLTQEAHERQKQEALLRKAQQGTSALSVSMTTSLGGISAKEEISTFVEDIRPPMEEVQLEGARRGMKLGK